MYLTQDQINFYHENGYLAIENFWDEGTVKVLIDEITTILQNADLSAVKSIFSTKENNRNRDDYFLTSGGEIRFFWEEKAWSEDGQLTAPKEVAINKIGHALHDLNPEFQKVSYEGRIGSICHELGINKPLAVQSMYIFKQPRIGGEVVPHQDGTFLYTEPQSCIGFWWPLHDCTKENGCLWIVPGSHKKGVLQQYRRRDPPATGAEIVPKEPVEWDLKGAVPLETRKGALVILHGAVVHYSEENHSPFPRHAYSIHVVEGSEGFVYPAENWLQRPGFPFREVTNRVD
jgi:phytanoyl-CoA hydroxylase